jgi:7-cyano-7-deazaguanine reductase
MTPNTPEHTPQGQDAAPTDAAAGLRPVPREPQRRGLGLAGSLPFLGADLWTAFELSWLNLRGKPQVALAHITLPCESSHRVDGASLQRYLYCLSDTRFESADAVRECLRRDLSAAIWHGGPVQASAGVRLLLPELFDREPVHELDGLCIDRLDVECTPQPPAPEALSAALHEQPVTETLVSHLFKTLCPDTGAPNWGSLQIGYSGPQLDQAGLLQYILGFRQHASGHEHSVERIYMDIMARCKPTKLMVYARFTRRDGLDINPWRSSHPQRPPANARTARQ